VELAKEFGDDDFGAALLGDLSLAFVGDQEFEKAEKIARLIKGQEKSEHLRALGEAEAKAGQPKRAMAILHEGCEAAFIYEFPTQQAQNLAGIAATMEIADKDEAAKTWEEAVKIAMPAQDANGTDGPEASGVLLQAVEAFLRLGLEPKARAVAATIKLPSLRERAAALCK
jgi:hypothetical protein